MSRLEDVFRHGREKNRAAFMPYLMAGYPSPEHFCELVTSVHDGGADILEIGIPFSDPLADGPTIQAASQTALENGVSVSLTLELLESIPNGNRPPIVIMSYFNPVLRYGLGRFLDDAARVGVSGLIVPDVVCEESGNLKEGCANRNIDLVLLLAPTSSAKRSRMILEESRGFVYAVTVAGTTGARATLPISTARWLSDLKSESMLPIAAGFGISTAEQAHAAALAADGVIVGSALLKKLSSRESWPQRHAAFMHLFKQLRSATERAASENPVKKEFKK